MNLITMSPFAAHTMWLTKTTLTLNAKKRLDPPTNLLQHLWYRGPLSGPHFFLDKRFDDGKMNKKEHS